MQVVCYNFAATGITATTQNIATIQTVKPGRIICVEFDFAIVSGAAAADFAVELTKSGQAGGTQMAGFTQNPGRDILVGALYVRTNGTAGATDSYSKIIPGLSMALAAGDIMALGSRLISGTAPTAGGVRVGVYVAEN